MDKNLLLFFKNNLNTNLTKNGQFPWPLFGRDDLQGGGHVADPHDRVVGLVRSRDGQLQVLALEQLRRHVLQLQRGQLQVK